ncbi:MAG: DUF389 domain-containing protein [Armatimonadetes bacterium]|nr:MAG: DUF389 domain-containing protein [Armatimonadota bacterium]
MTTPPKTPTDPHPYLPDWVNPVTMRGLVLVLAGLITLTFPSFSEKMLQWVVVGALVVLGASTLWSALRSKPTKYVDIAIGIAYLAVGIGLAVFSEAAVGVIAKAIGVVMAIVGLGIIVRVLRHRRSDINWTFNVVRGGLYIAAGLVVAVLPDAIASSLILAAAAGAIILGALTLAIGLTEPDASDISPGDLGAFAKEWLTERDLGDDMRDEVVDSLFFEEPGSVQKQVGFWVLLVLSVAIATLGVLADSTAVVIGAMLVAPLMTPIMGVSAAIVNGWMRRVSTSFATIVGGVGVAIGVSWIIAAWTPQLIPLSSNTQVLSRISPTLIDLMIAVAAGAAGAYATIDKRVSSSITGVAIAVALVPPLAVVGVTLKDGSSSDALGAFLLFATNLVSIILVASVVFLVGGLAPIESMRENSAKMRTIIGTVLLGALIIIVPLAFTSEGIIVSAARQSTAQRLTREWLKPETEMTVNRVTVDGSDIAVVISGKGTLPSIETLESDLESQFNEEVTVTVEYFPSEILTSDSQ